MPRPKKNTTGALAIDADRSNDRVLSPMPSKVIRVLVSEKSHVKKGELLIVVEAMKMEHQMKASRDAVIKSVAVKTGDRTTQDQVLVEFEAVEEVT